MSSGIMTPIKFPENGSLERNLPTNGLLKLHRVEQNVMFIIMSIFEIFSPSEDCNSKLYIRIIMF